MNRHARIVTVILITLLGCASAAAATVDGIELHYSSHGNGPKTLILVHGWTCDETSWKEQIAALSKDYRVITVDLPGHGKSGSPKDGNFSMELFARAVEAVRNEAKAEKVVLAGHSMGTPVVVQYARMFPQRTVAMVFVDGLVRIGPAMGSAPTAQQFSGPEGRRARENMIRGMFSPATTPAMQSHILSMMLGAPEATAVGAMRAAFAMSIPASEVVKIPVLGIYAERSRLTNLEAMKTTYSRLQYTEIPGTGHFLMIEKPDPVNKLVLDFLKTQSW